MPRKIPIYPRPRAISTSIEAASVVTYAPRAASHPLMTHPERVSGAGRSPRWSGFRRSGRLTAGAAVLLLALTGPQASAQRRDSQTARTTTALPNFRGVIKQIDGKSITLALDDHRELDFKRTDKTKFFKGGSEIKSPDFKAGEQVSVEGQEDLLGNLVAVNVYWEKVG